VTSLRGLRLAAGNAGNDQPCQVSMDATVFDGDVWLHGARLRKLSANGAVFGNGLSMEGSYVEHDVGLADCSVAGDADFSGADFGALVCSGSSFPGKLSLRRTLLRGGGTFLQARFGRADFAQFACTHRLVLDEAHFEDSLRLDPNGLPQVSLRRTTLSAKLAASERFLLPSGWRVINGDREDTRYLVAL
jgi:hypothetical protein